LDSWSGQNEKTFQTVLKSSRILKIETIPAGTTGMIQPLDVFFFRPWKNFIKHFSDIVVLYNYEINLHLRNNIIKLQSLIHNQFSSHRFSNLLKYSWYTHTHTHTKVVIYQKNRQHLKVQWIFVLKIVLRFATYAVILQL